ncbi:MAG: N-acetyl-gamma-glutamyl-phosphate reductase [Flavobacteriaceae bacterium]
MIKAGIIGGSGYTGGELIRLLLQHEETSLDFVYSSTRPGTKISGTHPDLSGITDLLFTDKVNTEADVIFLCLGHGHSNEFLKNYSLSKHTKIIDLSTDFRHEENAVFEERTFIYGLPELQADKISRARNVANPGCFATAIQLALLPLADQQLLESSIHINGVTGSTGAGVKPSSTTHFSWRNNNLSWYKPFTHQHLKEIGQTVSSLQKSAGELYFLPYRGNFSRGILITAYTVFNGSESEANDLFRKFYSDAVFTQVVEQPIELKQVVNTNQCHIHLHKHGDVLLITSAIDNLLKGASGQAVQNMNLMFGLDQKQGLKLKAGVF